MHVTCFALRRKSELADEARRRFLRAIRRMARKN